MSKHIEVSDQDYARIQQAADADGMPLDAWVVANLPLEHENGAEPTTAPPCTNGRPARTMADMLAGRVGVINSGRAERLLDLPEIPPTAAPPRTMAERLAGRLGRVGSGTGLPSSDNVGQSFAEYLEEKQRNGRL